MSPISSPSPSGCRASRHALLGRFGIPAGPVGRVFAGTLINAIGNGMTLTLMVVYLTQVRGLRIGQATAVLALMAVLSLVCSPLSGTIIDKIGPRRLLLVTVPMMALSTAAIGHVRSFADAILIGALGSIAGSGNWSAQNTLLTQLTPAAQRQRVFGLSFMLLNLGIGIGGLVSASIVSLQRPETFELLYLINGATFLLNWLIVISLRGYGGPSPEHLDEHGQVLQRGWAHVMSDKVLRRYLLAALLLMICGYGNMEAGLSYYITTTVKLPVSTIGIIIAANTAAIVVAQLFMLSRIQGRSRSRMLAVVGVLWAASWALAWVASFTAAAVAVIILCAGQVVFAIGETIWAPVAPAMVNDMADDDVRGRYNSAQTMLWTVAGTVAPMLAGLLLQRGNGYLWLGTLVAGCLVATVVFMDLRRRVSAQVDGLAAHASPEVSAPAQQV